MPAFAHERVNFIHDDGAGAGTAATGAAASAGAVLLLLLLLLLQLLVPLLPLLPLPLLPLLQAPLRLLFIAAGAAHAQYDARQETIFTMAQALPPENTRFAT